MGFRRVQLRGSKDEGLQGVFNHGITFMEVDGADNPAIQTGVEELLWILDLGTFGKVSLTALLRVSPMQTIPS